MCHHIVTSSTFLCLGNLEVDIRQVTFHFVELLVGDVQAEFLNEQNHRCQRDPREPTHFFAFGQPEPEPSPRGELLHLAEIVTHLDRGVPRHQRRTVLRAIVERDGKRRRRLILHRRTVGYPIGFSRLRIAGQRRLRAVGDLERIRTLLNIVVSG